MLAGINASSGAIQIEAEGVANPPKLSVDVTKKPLIVLVWGGLYVVLIGGLLSIFQRVPAGLAHYKPLVTTMQANVDNFRQVNSLPDFRLFTWFFVVPGALLVLLAGWGLLGAGLAGRIVFHHGARPTPA